MKNTGYYVYSFKCYEVFAVCIMAALGCLATPRTVDIPSNLTYDLGFFWFGTDLRPFLFPGYDVVSFWGLFTTCLGLISLAIVYEAMKVFQIKLHKRTVLALTSANSSTLENSSLLTQSTSAASTGNSYGNWKKWARWIVEVLHWSAHTTLGYLLMLAVMTFNAYIGIALVIGASFGYWIFGMTLIEMNLAQFQQARNQIVRCDPECADAVENTERRASTISDAAEQLVAEVIADIHVPITNV